MNSITYRAPWLLVILLACFHPACSSDSPVTPESGGRETVISDDAVIVDELTDLSLTKMDDRRLVFSTTGDTGTLPFAEGDVLVSSQVQGAYLRRVTTIETSGDTVLVGTEEATLEDVILKGQLSWTGPLDFDVSGNARQGVVGSAHPAVRRNVDEATGDISYSLDGVGVELGADYGFKILQGSFRFGPSLDLDATFDRGLKACHVIIRGDLDFDIRAQVSFSTSVGVHGEVELLSNIPVSSPIYIQAGVVPVVITPTLDLLLGVSVAASKETSFTGGVSTDNTISAGFRWTEAGGFEAVDEKNFDGGVYPMEVSQKVEHSCRVYLKPRISFRVYAVAGPHIALKPYVEEGGVAYSLPRDEYCTEWSLGVGGEVGANLEVFSVGLSTGLDLADWSTALSETCGPRDGCYPELPSPELVVTGKEDYELNGQPRTRYFLDVTNWASYPDALFELAPDLPPCGLNLNAARSWVWIYRSDGSVLYGFCTLQAAENLRQIWFGAPRGEVPGDVYIEIWDRRCDLTYTSNLASTNVASRLVTSH